MATVQIRKDFDSLYMTLMEVVAEMDEAQEVAMSASADDEGGAWQQAITESDKLLDEATKLLNTIEMAHRSTMTYYDEKLQECRDWLEYAQIRNRETHAVEGPQGKHAFDASMMR